jgi:hypothetical protein
MGIHEMASAASCRLYGLTMERAELGRDGWELESAVERHRQHPETFEIPSEDELSTLGPGWQAKLLFWFTDGSDAQCERAWVTIEEVVSPGTFRGRLASPPASSGAPLQLGAQVEFASSDVCGINQQPEWQEELEFLTAFNAGDEAFQVYLAKMRAAE